MFIEAAHAWWAMLTRVSINVDTWEHAASFAEGIEEDDVCTQRENHEWHMMRILSTLRELGHHLATWEDRQLILEVLKISIDGCGNFMPLQVLHLRDLILWRA